MAKKKSSSRSRSAAKGLGPGSRIVVLHGSEAMLMKQAFDELRAAIAAEHGEVDPIVLDGDSAALSDVLDELRTQSLLQGYQLVVVDAADEFAKRFRAELERYAAGPADQSTLVLRSSRWNKGKLDTLIAKVGGVFKFEPLPPDKAQQWLVERAASHHERRLDPRAAALLVQRMGTSLMKLDTELAKLALSAGASQTIDEQMVRLVSGRASDEQAWVVQEAMLSAIASAGGRGAPAPAAAMIGKVHELIDVGRQPEVMLVWSVADLMRKLFLAIQLQRQGMQPFNISRELRIWPRERQPIFFKALEKLDEPAVRELYRRILELDARAKSGFGEAMRNLECFCVELAGKAG